VNGKRAKALADELGERALPCVADVRDARELEDAMSNGCRRFGPLRVAVACAGVASSAKIVANGQPHDPELWAKVIEVNLTGTFNFIRLAAALMAMNEPDGETGERGAIISTASIAAFDGQRGQVAYAASKAAIAGMTLPLARDLADKAIRCMCIAPGLFDTEILQDVPSKGIEALKGALLFPARMGDPREYAALVCHIVENPYLNGECLRLDGGARLAS
jgi:NAD(P)-dependent dehydrogenase (short-subunit alcohol dehydrogenase family)